MSTVFIGGSRHVSRLSAQVKERLANITRRGFRVVVGDAAGADKAVQKYLMEISYSHVVVYCSGNRARNNLGDWETRKVPVPSHVKGFQFFAAKDREMAKQADFGLMIWDGESPGTALNVLRLLRAGKKAVLLNVPEKHSYTFKVAQDWATFISQCHERLVEDLRSRATPEEWQPVENTPISLLDAVEEDKPPAKPDAELTDEVGLRLSTKIKEPF